MYKLNKRICIHFRDKYNVTFTNDLKQPNDQSSIKSTLNIVYIK